MSVGIFSDTLLNILTDVPVDTKFSEHHGITATPARFALENGATITDHIVLNPQTLEVPYILTNNDTPLNISTPLGSSYGIRSATLYNILRNNLRNRTLYTIVTRHVLYQNMALIDSGADHVSPETGTIVGIAKFQQVNRGNIQNVQIPTSQTAQDGTQLKAASTVPVGTQTLLDVNSTPNLLERELDTWSEQQAEQL